MSRAQAPQGPSDVKAGGRVAAQGGEAFQRRLVLDHPVRPYNWSGSVMEAVMCQKTASDQGAQRDSKPSVLPIV